MTLATTRLSPAATHTNITQGTCALYLLGTSEAQSEAPYVMEVPLEGTYKRPIGPIEIGLEQLKWCRAGDRRKESVELMAALLAVKVDNSRVSCASPASCNV